MKNALVPVLAVFLAFVAVPAFAGDGQVPQATLRALGLGGIQVASDAEGMQVRGLSSSAASSGMTAFSMAVVDPLTASTFLFAGANFSRATEENAGLNTTSNATANTATGLAVPINININAGAFTAVIAVFSVGSISTAQGG